MKAQDIESGVTIQQMKKAKNVQKMKQVLTDNVHNGALIDRN